MNDSSEAIERPSLLYDVHYWRDQLERFGNEGQLLRTHLEAVSRHAGIYANTLRLPPEDVRACEVFGLVHDIGKIPSIADTGFHPLDGAAFVASKGSSRLAALVAHHSGALHEASLRGISIPYPRETSFVARVVWYADMTTKQNGENVTLEERRADIEHRYGGASIESRALATFYDELLEVQDLITTASRPGP